MDAQKERLERELDHLKKTYKAGIMSEKEYNKGKDRIENKLKDLSKKDTKKEVKKEEKSKKIIDEILGDDEPKKDKKTTSNKNVKKEESNFPIGVLVIIIIIIILGVLIYNRNTAIEPVINTDKVVTLTIYSDVHCPHEAKLENLLKQIRGAYGQQVQFRYVHTPLDETSVPSMIALICAGQQEVFWKYHAKLANSFTDLTEEDFLQMASSIEGVDLDKFSQCLSADQTEEVLANEILEGSSIKVGKTPSFVIGNELYEGFRDFEQMKAILNRHFEN